MNTSHTKSSTTLCVIDMQEKFIPIEGCNSYLDARDELITNITTRIEETLLKEGEIIFVNYKGGGNIIPELEKYSQDPRIKVINKYGNGVFEKHHTYEEDGIDEEIKSNKDYFSNKLKKNTNLEIIGVNTDYCVLSSYIDLYRFIEKEGIPVQIYINLLCCLNISNIQLEEESFLGKNSSGYITNNFQKQKGEVINYKGEVIQI